MNSIKQIWKRAFLLRLYISVPFIELCPFVWNAFPAHSNGHRHKEGENEKGMIAYEYTLYSSVVVKEKTIAMIDPSIGLDCAYQFTLWYASSASTIKWIKNKHDFSSFLRMRDEFHRFFFFWVDSSNISLPFPFLIPFLGANSVIWLLHHTQRNSAFWKMKIKL